MKKENGFYHCTTALYWTKTNSAVLKHVFSFLNKTDSFIPDPKLAETLFSLKKKCFIIVDCLRQFCFKNLITEIL